MATGDFSGAGFLVGGLVGEAANRSVELNSAQEASANLAKDGIALLKRIEELNDAAKNMFGAHVRLKADYEGMRAVIRDLLGAIEDGDRESPMLIANNRDAIAGEASRLADEVHQDSMFSPQMSRRAGMLAVIQACIAELSRIAPDHKLLHADQRFASYWATYQVEADSRMGSVNQIVSWGQDRGKTDKALRHEPGEYYDQVPAAWKKRDTLKSG